MAQILVIQHGEMGPGRLGSTLRDHAFRLDIRRVAGVDHPDRLPPDLDGVHGLVVLGGPQSVGDQLPWMEQERAIIREAHDRSLPIVGICLGHQMIAAALGGTVERMPTPEWGLTKVSLTVPGQTESTLGGMPWDTMQFQSHADAVVEAPPGATVLASSERCGNQIMRVGQRTFGFQFHFEADLPTIDRYAAIDTELMSLAGVEREPAMALIRERYDRFATVADRLCVNMATYLFPFHALTRA